MIELGGNIELVGFKELDNADLSVVKKMVGSYASRIQDRCEKFEKLTVTIKNIHESEKGGPKKFELHSRLLDNGKSHTSETVDFNLFFALDKVLKKLEHEMGRK